MAASLRLKGFKVNRKRITRLMNMMGIEAVYPKRKIRTTFPGYVHSINQCIEFNKLDLLEIIISRKEISLDSFVGTALKHNNYAALIILINNGVQPNVYNLSFGFF